MSQQSEERVSAAEIPHKARILPFERPQSELQRAVQVRAQERMEAESIKPKTSPVRSIVALAVATVPVLLIFSGFFVAVQAVRLITSLYIKAPQAAATTIEQPQSTEPEVQQPGVVMLVPDRSIKPLASPEAPAAQGSSSGSKAAAAPAK